MPTEYTIPLEIAYGDVREIQFDDEVTAGMILEKLVGKETNPQDTGTYCLLELVYDAVNRLREMRKLENDQPMYQLVPAAMAPKGSVERSILSLVGQNNEVTIFFNPYFRMLTGFSQEHFSFFPEEMMNVASFEGMIKSKMGLHPKDLRFGLYGNFGTHVARLEESMVVATLKRAHDNPSSPGFFQFQVIPEHADQEILGADRATWLYVKSHKGFHREHKYWCALKGTCLFMYKGSSRTSGRIGYIDRIDECRILNVGFNAPHTRYYVQIMHPNGSLYSLSCAYPKRMRKWIRVLNACHKVLDTQMPITARTLAGIKDDSKSSKYVSRRPSAISPRRDDEVKEPTEMQKAMLEKPEDILKLIRTDGKSLIEQPDMVIARQWLETLRLYLNTIIEFRRPGFVKAILPTISTTIEKICKWGQGIEDDGVTSSSYSVVEDILDQCERCFAIFKSYVMDEAPFPKDINKDEQVFNPKVQEIKLFLSNSDYYEMYESDDEDEIETPKMDLFEEEEEEGIEFSVDNYMKNLRVNSEEDFVSFDGDEDDGETEYDEDDIEEIKHEEMPSDITDKKKISSASSMKSKIKGIFTK
jgi:hypothetical protein